MAGGKVFTLYWSSLIMYEECPQRFLWERGWGDIDLGRGPGRGKEKPYRRSRHHAVMGIVIQGVIEKMINDELWKEPHGLADRLLKMVEKEWAYETAKSWNWIDYRVAGTKESLLQICRDGVIGYLRTMKANKLLGEWTKAELDLVGWVDKWNPIGGRPDVIFRRSDTGITIIDGKNAKSKGKYTDPDQLRWYAQVIYLTYRKMVDRLAFVYYRYPHGAPILDKDDEPVLDEDGNPQLETGIDWVEFNKDDLRGLAQRAVEARKGMDKKKFPATPVPKTCRWCDFAEVCPPRQEQLAKNRRKSPKAIAGLSGAGGFMDLDLGGSSSG